MHTSIKLDTPIEFINITPLNPLISKCQIKVCYVGDAPNRNRSVITKEVAKQMANSLPGCPIVGFYNEEKGDFEEHNRIIDISNGKFEIKDTTRPYGFVDLGAKVWFQKFLDDGENEREYMMTEGWLWTGQYPECKRILEKGNNQSMELDEGTINAHWSKDNKGERQFFIINEAIISKLCTLGEENEPCFETANIGAPTIQFAFADGFKEQVFSMMNELKELLNKGGEKVFTRYAVEIGDALWTALYSHVEGTYGIESVCKEDEQLFAVLSADENYYRLNFSIAEDGTVSFDAEVSALEGYTPSEEPQFSAEAVAEYAKAKKEEKEKNASGDDKKCPKCGKAKDECTCGDDKGEEGSEDKKASEDNKEDEKKTADDNKDDDEEKCPDCGKPKSKCTCKKDKKQKYNLDEIQEYVELSEKYSALETEHNTAKDRIAELEAQLGELTTFKLGIEKAEKKKMIDSFYMLSDEEKADVITNIDNYSLDDIEAKLSIICVRNKVSFNLDDDKNDQTDPTTFSLNNNLNDEAPAWVKAIRSVASNM